MLHSLGVSAILKERRTPNHRLGRETVMQLCLLLAEARLNLPN
jgi:hypothetical protein